MALVSLAVSALRSVALLAAGAMLGAGITLAVEDDPRVPYDPTPGDLAAMEVRVLAAERTAARSSGKRAPSKVTCERRSGPGEEDRTGKRRYRCLALRFPEGVRTPGVTFASPYSGFIDLDDGRQSIRSFQPQHGM